MKTISWFSTGVSSAIATKLVIDDIDEIIYTHIDDQHKDSIRFVKECGEWFGKEIKILQSGYKTVESVCSSTRFINGPTGAACTRVLKKRVRKDFEANQTEALCYIWGLDMTEKHRADRLKLAMPDFKHRFPLIEKQISKAEAHRILAASGIKRPAMYELGYANNNCIGCVKGGKGYWNKIRVDFPDIFKARAKMERDIGRSCINGVFLDELPEDEGRDQKPICDDCGIFCEIMKLL